MTAPADVLIGVVPVVLAAAFLLLIVQSMGDRATGLVDKMKQAVGGAVMLLVALLVVFAFLGGGGGDDPGPDPPEPAEEYDVLFHVASDSQGYGSVSTSSLSDVPEGTSVTVGQTIVVGTAGQCAATPAADTAQYTYAFSGWTGADDDSTPAATTISADTAYYAHFTRTEVTYTVSFHVATDSAGYGTVSQASLSDVPYGATVTLAQTLTVGSAGQCSATPYTTPYVCTFSGWTGADDASTPAATTISADTAYYAHFARGPMDSSLFTFTVADGKATVTGWQTGAEPEAGYDLVFPETDGQGHPVTNIGGSASNDTPPPWIGAGTAASSTATAIEDRAFRYASSLTSADFPNVVTVGRSALAHATSLATVSLPAATTIGDYALSEDPSLAAVSLPSATTIGEYAFFDDSSLVSVSLPAATTIGRSALRGVGASTISLPSATTIGDYVFNDTPSLTTVSLPAAESVGTTVFNRRTDPAYEPPLTSLTLGPLTGTLNSSAFSVLTFYDTDGTTVLSKTAANLKNSTFVGTASALIKVAPGAKSLSEDMERRVLELTAENQAKAAMLAEIDPALAGMDPSDVARMTVDEIRSLTPEDVESMKAEIERRRAADEGEPPGGE